MDVSEAGSSGIKTITRRSFYNIMQEHPNNDINEKLDHAISSLLNSQNYSEKQRNEVKRKLSNLKSEMKRRWIGSHYIEDHFLKKNHSWLQGTFDIPETRFRPGRPQKSFSDVSERSKRRKTEALRSGLSSKELTFATHTKLRCEGKIDASNVIKDLTQSPTRAKKYRKAYNTNENKESQESIVLTPLQALSMFVEAGLTRRQYEIIRSFNKKMYPCYTVLQKAKRDCYPRPESYRITTTSAEVNLQDVLNHTATRLLHHLADVIKDLNSEESNLSLIYKWGCDGSQQTTFKQKFGNDSESDANIFQSSFVPLQLCCNNGSRIIWRNPLPSSPRFCRPIRIRFVKESVDITNEEIRYIENKINSLETTQIRENNKIFAVKHTMMFTVVDAKVCNAATNTKSTMKCYICGATSKNFNDLSKQESLNEDALKFGLSILHARIRFFEGLLHIAYKLPVKKWQLRNENEKETVKQRKFQNAIQKEFKTQLGLIVDVPKAGFGNTNDGNTSRRFFADHELSATITGIDSRLIYRLKIILETISSGHSIDIKKIESFCLDTAKLYVELYPWHPMTPTLHKILLHGPIVIKKSLLPIGMMSEEAAEARNKHFRLYRQEYARKLSRESCNLDVINRLLLSSDPLITGLRPTPKKTTKPFMKETLDMLLPAETMSSLQLSEEEYLSQEQEPFVDEPWMESE